jgi:hypothetical protein
MKVEKDDMKLDVALANKDFDGYEGMRDELESFKMFPQQSLNEFGPGLQFFIDLCGLTHEELCEAAVYTRELLIEDGYLDPATNCGGIGNTDTLGRCVRGEQRPGWMMLAIWMHTIWRYYHIPWVQREIIAKTGRALPKWGSNIEGKKGQLFFGLGYLSPRNLPREIRTQAHENSKNPDVRFIRKPPNTGNLQQHSPVTEPRVKVQKQKEPIPENVTQFRKQQ